MGLWFVDQLETWIHNIRLVWGLSISYKPEYTTLDCSGVCRLNYLIINIYSSRYSLIKFDANILYNLIRLNKNSIENNVKHNKQNNAW